MDDVDIKSIEEAGFDNTLNIAVPNSGMQKYTKPDSITGGTFSEGVYYMGSDRLYFDTVNKRLVVDDGSTKRGILGQNSLGEYGVFISKPGTTVESQYTGDYLLYTRDDSEWRTYDPSRFTFVLLGVGAGYYLDTSAFGRKFKGIVDKISKQ